MQKETTEVPQWLIDHMADAPEELRAYVFRVFKTRSDKGGNKPQSASELYTLNVRQPYARISPETDVFWVQVYLQQWRVALAELYKFAPPAPRPPAPELPRDKGLSSGDPLKRLETTGFIIGFLFGFAFAVLVYTIG
jgi:hypothetical protein